MSTPGRAADEFRNAQNEGSPMDPVAPSPTTMTMTMTMTMTPTERLAITRERLREALRAPVAAGAAAGPGLPAAWLDSLRQIPGAAVVLDAVKGWWAQHPWRVTALLVGDAGKAALQPVAQRHPLALVLAAVVLGGLLAWGRPWRWILKPALFAGLLPQLFGKTLAQVPVASWMAVLASLTKPAAQPATQPAPGSPPQPN